MLSRPTPLTDALHDYLLAVSLREPAVLKSLRTVTQRIRAATCRFPRSKASSWRCWSSCSAQAAIEIGIFTGYSALRWRSRCRRGRLSPATSAMIHARRRPFWAQAGVADKIELRSRLRSRRWMRCWPRARPAVRFRVHRRRQAGYDAYYERCLQLLRAGRADRDRQCAVGRQRARTSPTDRSAPRRCGPQRKAEGRQRVDISLLPIGDGLTLARKR